MAKWQIKITDFLGGLTPVYWQEDYPRYGNKNMAGDMKDIDLLNPSHLTQGPGLSALTNGTESGNVSTLITSILDKAVSSDTTYAVGGDQVYTISSTSVDSAHTISGTNVEAEDIIEYQGNIYYSYNCDSGGDIGKYDIDADTWDDTWLSDKLGNNISDNPHPMMSGGSDRLYVGDGNFVNEYIGDEDTYNAAGLDLPEGNVVKSLVWSQNRLWIAANRPDISGDNKAIATIYVWDTVSDSWNSEIRMNGKIGGIENQEGITYVFYRDVGSGDGYQLGYIDGSMIKEVTGFTGGLPDDHQVTEYENVLIWTSGQKIYSYGAVHSSLKPMLTQIASATYGTVGALASPFGTPMIASTDSSNYELAKFSNYTTDSYWQSLLFNVSSMARKGVIKRIIVKTNDPGSGAQCDVSLLDATGSSQWSDSITSGTSHLFTPGIRMEEAALKLDFSNGSTSNPVKVKSIHIKGDTHE